MPANNYLTIDIGSKNIKILSGCYNNGIIDIYDYDIVPTPNNSYRDGEIIDVVSLVEKIKESLSKFSMKVKKVILTITGSNVIARNIQLPKATESEIGKMIMFEVTQFLPFDVEEYSVDYKIIEDEQTEKGIFTQVLVVAVPIIQVEKYLEIHEKLRLNLEAIDSPINCISKFFLGFNDGKYLNNNDQKGEFAVIDFGAETTSIYIFTPKGLKFNRVLRFGSSEFEREICRAFEIDFKSAEDLKHSRGSLLYNDIQYDLDDRSAEMTKILGQVTNNILLEIDRLFDFYNTRFNVKGIEKILICGGGASVPGLDKYIESHFEIPTENVSLSSFINYKDNKKSKEIEKDLKFLTNALGAIIRAGE